MALASDTTQNAILQRCAIGLRKKLSLTSEQCYEAVIPAYVDGQAERVFQVCPEAVAKQGGGEGLQNGGALQRKINIRIAYWLRSKLDQHQRAELALTAEAYGMMDTMESIRGVFAMTTLGYLLVEPMKYEAETTTMVYDADAGIFRRDIVFSCVWAESLPKTPTLVSSDFE